MRRWRGLLELSGLLAGLLVGLICLGVCVDVAMRWTGTGALPWMLETIEYLQYLMVLVGAAWVLARGAHVAIDAVVLAVSPAMRKRLERGASAFAAVVSLLFAVIGTSAAVDTWRTGAILYKSVTLPEWVPVAALALAFAMLAAEFALQAAGRFAEREALDL